MKGLLALFLINLTLWQAVAEGPRVKWGGLLFRGKSADREKLYPVLSKPEVTDRLQNALASAMKQVSRQDCSVLVGEKFELSSGDSLVLGCVIEDEDTLVAKVIGENGDEYYGQVTIAASLVVFDFKQGVVISSSIVSSLMEFGKDQVLKLPPTTEQIDAFVGKLVFGPFESEVDLVSRVKVSMVTIPIKEKANFGRLQVSLPEFDEKTLKEMDAVDEFQKQRTRRQICQKIASSLAQDFRLNVLPPTDGDSTLQTMTVSFADKSQISENGPSEKVFQLRPPTVIGKIQITGGTDYVQKKLSNQVQTVKAFGSQSEIQFFELGNLKYEKVWAYGVNKGFAPAFADQQVESVRRLYHRQAIENGFQKKFMDVVGKEKAWKELVSKLTL